MQGDDCYDGDEGLPYRDPGEIGDLELSAALRSLQFLGDDMYLNMQAFRATPKLGSCCSCGLAARRPMNAMVATTAPMSSLNIPQSYEGRGLCNALGTLSFISLNL
jgi:hypothetical protein